MSPSLPSCYNSLLEIPFCRIHSPTESGSPDPLLTMNYVQIRGYFYPCFGNMRFLSDLRQSDDILRQNENLNSRFWMADLLPDHTSLGRNEPGRDMTAGSPTARGFSPTENFRNLSGLTMGIFQECWCSSMGFAVSCQQIPPDHPLPFLRHPSSTEKKPILCTKASI